MVSTMQIDDDVSAKFTAMRFKRAHRWVIAKLDEAKTNVIVESAGDRAATFDDFREAMPKDEPRWAVYDLEFKTDDGRAESKLVFLMYAPDNAKDKKDCFVYANSKEQVQAKMSPINKTLQINDHADINEKSFIEEF